MNKDEKIKELERENIRLKRELKKLDKSDASKENASIEYYNLYKEFKNKYIRAVKAIEDFDNAIMEIKQ